MSATVANTPLPSAPKEGIAFIREYLFCPEAHNYCCRADFTPAINAWVLLAEGQQRLLGVSLFSSYWRLHQKRLQALPPFQRLDVGADFATLFVDEMLYECEYNAILNLLRSAAGF